MDGQVDGRYPVQLPSPQVPSPQVQGRSGRTVIAEAAVAKVASVAARSVEGVYALGSGTARALASMRDAAGSSNLTHGVHTEVGETEVAVDINLVAEYGQPLQQVANRVRSAVYAAVENLVGLRVIEVNVEINDVHIAAYEQAKHPSRPRRGSRTGVRAPGAGNPPDGAGRIGAEAEATQSGELL